jgi:predicted Zn-ribbon and HTH transcriptional regulator
MEQTIRQSIMEMLRSGFVSALQISAAVSIQEKEVASHLKHIEKSLHGSGGAMLVTPAACKKCGFVFTQRRHAKPGKCPRCRATFISEPLFAVKDP